MSTKWMIGLMMLFLLCVIISGVCEMTYLGAKEVSKFEVLMQVTTLNISNPIFAAYELIVFVFDHLETFWGILTFDYAFFQGAWLIVRYFCMAIGVGVLVSFLLAIRGTSSA